ELTPPLVQIAVREFSTVLAENHLQCHACAIMSTHVHMVLCRAAMRAEDMIAALQDGSREPLRQAAGVDNDHPIWGGPGWKVFVNSRESVLSKIAYVENNPIEVGQPRQYGPFVIPYVG